MSCGKTSTSPAAGSNDLFQSDVKALLLGPRPVIGKIEALLDESIDIDRSVFTRAFARVQQHVLDDGIGALAVLTTLSRLPCNVSAISLISARSLLSRFAPVSACRCAGPRAGKPARTPCWATNCGHHSNRVIYGYTP